MLPPLHAAALAAGAAAPRYYWNVDGAAGASAALQAAVTAAAGDSVAFGGVELLTTYFGRYPCIACAGQAGWCNGGLPQLANLSAHYDHMRQHLDSRVPQGYSGYLVQDYESWEPFWETTPEVYRNGSLALARLRDPALEGAALAAAAQAQYEAAAAEFLSFTLHSVRQLRPDAKGYGYYGYPAYPYWPAGVNQSALNDRLGAVWGNTTAVYVSIYLPYKSRMHPDDPGEQPFARNVEFIDGKLREALRIASLSDPPLPVVPYTWYRYHDGEPSGLQFLTENDTDLEFGRPLRTAGVGPAIIWGSEGSPDAGNATARYIADHAATFRGGGARAAGLAPSSAQPAAPRGGPPLAAAPPATFPPDAAQIPPWRPCSL